MRRMSYARFRRLLAEMVDELPPEFTQGLQGVHAIEEAKPEDGYVDVWRMGEYLDPGAEDFLGAGEGLGRHVALYYGSFVQIAADDPGFEWEEEMWETLTHELRHHVESLAGDDSLIQEDERVSREFERDAREDDDAEPRPLTWRWPWQKR
jgi:hypothetical protein